MTWPNYFNHKWYDFEINSSIQSWQYYETFVNFIWVSVFAVKRLHEKGKNSKGYWCVWSASLVLTIVDLRHIYLHHKNNNGCFPPSSLNLLCYSIFSNKHFIMNYFVKLNDEKFLDVVWIHFSIFRVLNTVNASIQAALD